LSNSITKLKQNIYLDVPLINQDAKKLAESLAMNCYLACAMSNIVLSACIIIAFLSASKKLI
jgi:hypothetical protein